MRRARSRAGSARRSLALLASLLALAAGACRLTEPAQTDAPPPPPETTDAAAAPHDGELGRGALAEPAYHASEAPEPVRVLYPGQSLGPLVAEARGAVVNIRTTVKVKDGPSSMYPGGGGDLSLGSGFFIDTEGHVLTNAHILAQARKLQVAFATGAGERVLPARIVGRAPELDVALLAVDTDLPLVPMAFGASSALQVGEWVVALGNPFGRELTASAGIVASTEGPEDAPAPDTTPAGYRGFLMTDAAIHAGNSGGPLVDIAGRVVGINLATSVRGGGLGFAVPIDRVAQILPTLKRDGRFRRSWLGVFIHPVPPAEAERRGIEGPRGALVSKVVPGSPAAKADIRPGDIILRFDGRAVDHRDLPWLSASTGAGRHIPVVVLREDGEHALALVSELMP